jgi:hypothetical protein
MLPWLTIRETRSPAAWFLEYFFSRASEAYQANGFAKLPDAEFGETLPCGREGRGNERPRDFPASVPRYS